MPLSINEIIEFSNDSSRLLTSHHFFDALQRLTINPEEQNICVLNGFSQKAIMEAARKIRLKEDKFLADKTEHTYKMHLVFKKNQGWASAELDVNVTKKSKKSHFFIELVNSYNFSPKEEFQLFDGLFYCYPAYVNGIHEAVYAFNNTFEFERTNYQFSKKKLSVIDDNLIAGSGIHLLSHFNQLVTGKTISPEEITQVISTPVPNNQQNSLPILDMQYLSNATNKDIPTIINLIIEIARKNETLVFSELEYFSEENQEMLIQELDKIAEFKEVSFLNCREEDNVFINKIKAIAARNTMLQLYQIPLETTNNYWQAIVAPFFENFTKNFSQEVDEFNFYRLNFQLIVEGDEPMGSSKNRYGSALTESPTDPLVGMMGVKFFKEFLVFLDSKKEFYEDASFPYRKIHIGRDWKHASEGGILKSTIEKSEAAASLQHIRELTTYINQGGYFPFKEIVFDLWDEIEEATEELTLAVKDLLTSINHLNIDSVCVREAPLFWRDSQAFNERIYADDKIFRKDCCAQVYSELATYIQTEKLTTHFYFEDTHDNTNNTVNTILTNRRQKKKAELLHNKLPNPALNETPAAPSNIKLQNDTSDVKVIRPLKALLYEQGTNDNLTQLVQISVDQMHQHQQQHEIQHQEQQELKHQQLQQQLHPNPIIDKELFIKEYWKIQAQDIRYVWNVIFGSNSSAMEHSCKKLTPTAAKHILKYWNKAFYDGLVLDNLSDGFFMRTVDGQTVLDFNPFYVNEQDNQPLKINPKISPPIIYNNKLLVDSSLNPNELFSKFPQNKDKPIKEYKNHSDIIESFIRLVQQEDNNFGNFNSEHILSLLKELAPRQFKKLYHVLISAGAVGVENILTILSGIRANDETTFLVLNKQFFKTKDHELREYAELTLLLEPEFQSTIKAIKDLPEEKRVWWNALCNQHELPRLMDLPDLFQAFQYFCNEVEGLIPNAKLPLPFPFSAVKHLKTGLNRLLIILKRSNNPTEQLAHLQNLSLSMEGPFYAMRYENFNLVTTEMNLEPSYEAKMKRTDPISYRVNSKLLNDALSNPELSFDDFSVLIYRWVGQQKIRSDFSSYVTLKNTINASEVLSPPNKKAIFLLLARTMSPDTQELHDEIYSTLLRFSSEHVPRVLDLLINLSNNAHLTINEIKFTLNWYQSHQFDASLDSQLDRLNQHGIHQILLLGDEDNYDKELVVKGLQDHFPVNISESLVTRIMKFDEMYRSKIVENLTEIKQFLGENYFELHENFSKIDDVSWKNLLLSSKVLFENYSHYTPLQKSLVLKALLSHLPKLPETEQRENTQRLAKSVEEVSQLSHITFSNRLDILDKLTYFNAENQASFIKSVTQYGHQLLLDILIPLLNKNVNVHWEQIANFLETHQNGIKLLTQLNQKNIACEDTLINKLPNLSQHSSKKIDLLIQYLKQTNKLDEELITLIDWISDLDEASLFQFEELLKVTSPSCRLLVKQPLTNEIREGLEKDPFASKSDESYTVDRVRPIIDGITDINGAFLNEAEKKNLELMFTFLNEFGSHKPLPLAPNCTIEQLSQTQLFELFHTLKNFHHQSDEQQKRENTLICLALAREVLYRATGIFPNSTQMLTVLGSLIHTNPHIDEVKAGQGKTVIIALQATLQWFDNVTPQLGTTNSALAKRDYEWLLPYYNSLGIRTNFIHADSDLSIYKPNQIYYGATSDLILFHSRRMLEGHTGEESIALILDEIDQAILDTGEIFYRNTGAFSSQSLEFKDNGAWLYQLTNEFIDNKLIRNATNSEDIIDFKHYLLSQLKINPFLNRQKISFISTQSDERLNDWINKGILAKILHEKVHYSVNDTVKIEDYVEEVSKFARPLRDARRQNKGSFAQGVQQFLHARKNSELQKEGKTEVFPIEPLLGTYTSMSSHDFILDFRLASNRILGYTGSAGSNAEKDELAEMYGFSFSHIPPHQMSKRKKTTLTSVEKYTENQKFEKMYEELAKIYFSHPLQTRQPLIIICDDIEQCDNFHAFIAKKLSQEEKAFVQKYHAESKENESDVIQQASLKGSITITTPILSRGTDFNPEHALGAVLAYFSRGSKRVHKQKKGRIARNDQPGQVIFIKSDESEARNWEYEKGQKSRELRAKLGDITHTQFREVSHVIAQLEKEVPHLAEELTKIPPENEEEIKNITQRIVAVTDQKEKLKSDWIDHINKLENRWFQLNLTPGISQQEKLARFEREAKHYFSTKFSIIESQEKKFVEPAAPIKSLDFSKLLKCTWLNKSDLAYYSLAINKQHQDYSACIDRITQQITHKIDSLGTSIGKPPFGKANFTAFKKLVDVIENTDSWSKENGKPLNQNITQINKKLAEVNASTLPANRLTALVSSFVGQLENDSLDYNHFKNEASRKILAIPNEVLITINEEIQNYIKSRTDSSLFGRLRNKALTQVKLTLAKALKDDINEAAYDNIEAVHALIERYKAAHQRIESNDPFNKKYYVTKSHFTHCLGKIEHLIDDSLAQTKRQSPAS